jgi:ribosomal protein S18 acetylase RimI-like enzyme
MPSRPTSASSCLGVRSSRERPDRDGPGLTGSEDRTVVFRVDPSVGEEELDNLFTASWRGYTPRDWNPVLRRSLVYICAYHDRHLIGFVNVAWDGGGHGFILDTTVHPELRRRGIGCSLVLRAASEARDRGVEWLHVDFESQLRKFYDLCDFRPTEAGLLHLGAPPVGRRSRRAVGEE